MTPIPGRNGAIVPVRLRVPSGKSATCHPSRSRSFDPIDGFAGPLVAVEREGRRAGEHQEAAHRVVEEVIGSRGDRESPPDPARQRPLEERNVEMAAVIGADDDRFAQGSGMLGADDGGPTGPGPDQGSDQRPLHELAERDDRPRVRPTGDRPRAHGRAPLQAELLDRRALRQGRLVDDDVELLLGPQRELHRTERVEPEFGRPALARDFDGDPALVEDRLDDAGEAIGDRFGRRAVAVDGRRRPGASSAGTRRQRRESCRDGNPADLEGVGSWQVLVRIAHDPGRSLVRREAAARGIQGRLEVRVASAGRRHGRHDDRPVQLERADGPDGRLVVERRLDVLRVDLESGREGDPLTGPAKDDEVPVVVDLCRVAGVRPAAGEHLGVELGPARVTRRDARPASQQLRIRRDLDQGPGHRPPGGPVRAVAAGESGDRRHLGRPVALHDHDTEILEEARRGGIEPGSSGCDESQRPAERGEDRPEEASPERERQPASDRRARSNRSVAPVRRTSDRIRSTSRSAKPGTTVRAVMRWRVIAAVMALGVRADGKTSVELDSQPDRSGAICPYMWLSGMSARPRSLPSPTSWVAAAAAWTIARWVRITPFGSLVVPDVNRISATTSAASPRGGEARACAPSTSVASRARTGCTPSSPEAIAGSMQASRAPDDPAIRVATPGIIRTSSGTIAAPIRQAAMYTATTHGPFGAQTRSRSPAQSPAAASLRATRSAFRPSSAYVHVWLVRSAWSAMSAARSGWRAIAASASSARVEPARRAIAGSRSGPPSSRGGLMGRARPRGEARS